MAKYLRILPSSQTTTTNGAILLDPNSILFVSSPGAADNTLVLNVNNLDTAADLLTITFSASDTGRAIQRQFMEAICSASSDNKSGVYFDLPVLIDSTGVARTITSFVYA